eukprot:10522130-Ditylum_brightwellii.AAC.1
MASFTLLPPESSLKTQACRRAWHALKLLSLPPMECAAAQLPVSLPSSTPLDAIAILPSDPHHGLPHSISAHCALASIEH